MSSHRSAVLGLLVAVALAAAPPARADVADERALAERYAPVVRLVAQAEECGAGEPYRPMDVDLLLDEPTVALRGPWNALDLVRIAPGARDLVGLYEYHLDFPGDALDPGCGYELWARRLTDGREPVVYAHVATDDGHPGKLALQYWFFYPYNRFNNLHEGDWETIQLVFDAGDAAEALAEEPVAAGYSQHEGSERADWGEEKLELVDGTHPVVYPAAGSHANFYTAALYLGSSAEQGVGCDDTRSPHVELRPRVETIPSEDAAARAAFPWIAFEGRWGELQEAFFNGPTGPNLKRSWTEPIEAAEDWRPRAYAIPGGGVVGTGATDFFCAAVGTGSQALVRLLRTPALMLASVGVLVALLLLGASRTRWRPAAPFRVARRRTWGQILAAASRAYLVRARLVLGIGALFVPLGVAVSLLQGLVLGGLGLVGVDATGESAGGLVLLLLAVGTTLSLLGLALVQAAIACALVREDAGEPIGPVRAYRLTLCRVRPLVLGLAAAVTACVALGAVGLLLPVAAWLAVRWSLLAQVVELEGLAALASLRRSGRLVRRRWLRVASLVGVGGALALLAGPFLGAVLILATDAPLPLLNVVAGVVYALAMPFVALTTFYVYMDARARESLAAELDPSVLPAEVDLG